MSHTNKNTILEIHLTGKKESFKKYNFTLIYYTWFMEPESSMPHSQGLSNNP